MKRPLLFTLFFISALCNIRASILKDNTGKNTRGFIECNTSSQVNRSPVSVWEKKTVYRNKNGVPSVAAGGDFAFMGSEYSENKSLGATYADRQFSVGNHLFFFTATHESVYGIRAESSTLKAPVPGNTLITRAVYVDQSVSVSGDGSSWSSAYKTLSEALRNAAGAATNDSILVAAGTYYPTGLQSDVNRDSSFAILRAGIKIYGGYPASGGQRDVSSNITALSGNIGDPADIDDNSVHVLVIAGIGISADSVVLDGVSFSDAAGSAIANTFKTYNGIPVLRTAGGGVNCTGNSNENIVFRNCTFTWNVLHSSIGGAGMYNSASSPMLKNCTFLLNYGNGSGGGMFNENASPVIDHCSFSGNGVEGSGGAIYNNNSGPVIINCTFDNNNNKGTGGAAIYNNISTPTITNCTFTNNQMKNFSTANTGGACIFNRSCPTFSITGCNFTGNTSNGLGGAGIFNYASSIIVTDCLFSGNIEGNDPGNGAGLYNGALSQAVITNCVFSGNYAGRNGGGLYNDGSTYTLTNCTFSGNYCATGGAIYNINSSSEPKIQNTIIWGNHGSDFPEIYPAGTDASITFSDILSLPGGTDGNINADPLFVDRPDPSPFSFVGGDYNLKPGSPALNAGNTALNASTVDIANNPRVVGTAIDMGAYEFQQTSLPVNLIIFNGSVQDGNATLRWQTGDETGLSRFELEKSPDGAIFSGVATITAKGSNNDYGYSLLQMEARAYYRLKMVEDNGKYRYSDILRLAQSLQNKTLVYPSPATDHVNIQSSVEGRLYIFDAQGKLVIQQMCKKGINLIDVSGLSEGIYYLQLGEKRMHFVKK